MLNRAFNRILLNFIHFDTFSYLKYRKNLNHDLQGLTDCLIMKYEDLTRKIIGATMEVHKSLGNGFQEVVYQRALSIEMNMQDISYEREKEMPLQYKGYDIGTRRVDFFVEGKIMVEIKALIKIEDVHLAQAMNCVEAYNMEIGLLLNFGAKSLQFKRVHNNILLNNDKSDS